MLFIKKYHFFLFLFVWTFLNFFQAANTVLLNDEAYYWVYSNFLAWGYFDHPPMIAALIKAGYFLFHNELGVRFFIVLLSTLTLVIIHSLLPRKDDVLFYAITCSILLLQIGGFVAAPDIPLAFFVALFFMVYKKFVTSSSWLQTVALGFVMALMLYSKYHGVLIILFTLISNPSLLKNIKAYVAVLITVALFTPHLYWQYLHGFPSVQYHLLERNESSYKISYSIEYVAGQLLIAGPFMGWLFLWASFKYKSTNLFEKALQFSLAGIYFFFLITTIKGRVEPNWTVAAIIPLIILSHQYLYDKIKWRKILFFTVPLSLAFIFFTRAYLISENKFIKFLNTNEFKQNKIWAKKINETSKGLPVVFINSYQKASKYWFYSGVPSFSLNTPEYRRNNYNFWPIEKAMQGKSVYAISPGDPLYFTDSIQTVAGILRGIRVDSFYSHADVQLKLNAEIYFNAKRNLIMHINAGNAKPLNIAEMKLQIHVFKEDKFIAVYDLALLHVNIIPNNITVISSAPVFLSKGKYFARLALSSGIPAYSSLNSTNLSFTVK